MTLIKLNVGAITSIISAIEKLYVLTAVGPFFYAKLTSTAGITEGAYPNNISHFEF